MSYFEALDSKCNLIQTANVLSAQRRGPFSEIYGTIECQRIMTMFVIQGYNVSATKKSFLSPCVRIK